MSLSQKVIKKQSIVCMSDGKPSSTNARNTSQQILAFLFEETVHVTTTAALENCITINSEWYSTICGASS